MTMNDTPKISVIMPAYNAEAYLPCAIDSILNQTYTDFELTVVDDGSSDSTWSVLKAYTARDRRIKILHTKNGGPGHAKNLALDSLDDSVDFVMFCDADDWVDKNMIRYLLDSAIDGANLVMSGFSIINNDGSQNNYFETDAALTRDTLGMALGRLYVSNLLNSACAKLFRNDIIQKNRIRFPDYRWGEDRFFVFDYLMSSYNITVNSCCGYKYVMHNGSSLVHSFYDEKVNVCKLINERIEELCRKYEVKDYAPFRYMFVKSIFSCMHNLFLPDCRLDHKEKREYIRAIINDQYILEKCSIAADVNAVTKLICKVIASGNITLNMAAARFSVTFSVLFPKTFRRIKHRK